MGFKVVLISLSFALKTKVATWHTVTVGEKNLENTFVLFYVIFRMPVLGVEPQVRTLLLVTRRRD